MKLTKVNWRDTAFHTLIGYICAITETRKTLCLSDLNLIYPSVHYQLRY